VTLDDKSARMDVRFFPDTYEQFESVLETDKILLIKGQVSFDDFSGGNTITARDVMDIVQAREKNARALALNVETQLLEPKKINQMQSILQAFKGGSCPVHLLVTHPDAEALITCGARWFVTPEDQLLHDLKQCLGEKAVSILYH
jgi:DNA polymerase-3 subunit alpha